MLPEALEHLVRGIVRHPDDVDVREKQLRRGSVLEVRVNPDDLGKVIGRNERTATAAHRDRCWPAGAVPGSTSSTWTAAADHSLSAGFRTCECGVMHPRVRGRADVRNGEGLRVLPFGVSDPDRPGSGAEAHTQRCEAHTQRCGSRHSTKGMGSRGPGRSWSAGSAGPTGSVARSPSSRAPTGPPLRRRRRPGHEAPRGPAPTGAQRPQALTVKASRWHQDRLLVTFEELADRTAAEAARGLVLLADVPEDARPEDPEEFYDHQLVGLRVVTTDGHDVGELTQVVHGSAQDLLVVRADGRDAMVPFVSALVPEVDLDGGRVLVADRPRPAHAARRRGLRCASTSSRSFPTTSRRCPVPAGRSPGGRHPRRAGPRPARLDPRPAPHGRRHLRRRRRMVMKPEPWGEALDALTAEGSRPWWWCRRRRGAVHPGDGRRARDAAAAAVRLRALRRHRPARHGPRPHAPGTSARSRSATTCSTAGGGGPRGRRGRRTPAPGLHGQPRVPRRGVPRRRRAAGVPGLHQAADLARS